MNYAVLIDTEYDPLVPREEKTPMVLKLLSLYKLIKLSSTCYYLVVKKLTLFSFYVS